MPRRLIDQCRSRSVMEIKILWQPVQLFYRDCHILRIGAAHGFSQQMPIATHVIFSGKAKFTRPTAEVGVDNHVITGLKPSSVCPAHITTECNNLSRTVR